uniref:Sorting nexin-27 n=1 Tax=Romanomermis culicivorax TaxID=13658 RepID=A0A915L5I5_ROMCU
MDSDSSDDEYPTNHKSRIGSLNPEPHIVIIEKSDTGFGFNVRGQVSEGGQLKSINGQLYAPLQHVSAVLRNGAAEKAGLLKGDRILEVNNVNVEGSNHKQVVDLIKAGGDKLVLTVISVYPSEYEKYDSGNGGGGLGCVSDDNGSPAAYDYSDKRSLPITIPSYQWVTLNGERFVVYNIYMAGRHLCSRRYNTFVQLNDLLRREFCDFNFPKMPGKWPFTLNEQQIDTRRRGLEQYIEKVCAVRVIAESDIVQEFLMDHQSPDANFVDVDMKILLPDQTTVTVVVKKNNTTDQVFSVLIKKLKISEEMSKYYALFETIDALFDRKLRSEELPHALYVQNYSSAACSCIVLKKWLFNLKLEVDLCIKDAFFNNICYFEVVTILPILLKHDLYFATAIQDVNAGKILAGDKLYHLKALQNASKIDEYLDLVRRFQGYNDVVFPHCNCDSRKEGHIVAIVNCHCFKIKACNNDGVLEAQIPVLEIPWSDIIRYAAETDCFIFEYQRQGKKSRIVKIFTPLSSFMANCFERVKEDLLPQKSPEEGTFTNGKSANGSSDKDDESEFDIVSEFY